MAARWCWALLFLCQLAAWGSAAPQDADKSHGKALGANAAEFSSHHQQLTDSAQDASDRTVHSADHNSPLVIQNKQPKAPQQDSVKPKGTENSSVNSQSGSAGSSNTEKDSENVRERQTGISDTLSLPESKTTELKPGEDSSVKTLNVKPDDPDQDSSEKTDASHSDLNVKKLEQSEDLERKDQHPHPGSSVEKPTSAKVDSSEVTNAHKDTSLPKPKLTELKPGEDSSIKTLSVKPGGPAEAKNKKTDMEISDPDFSELETNDEESQQMEDALAKDQDLQSDLSAKHPQKSNPMESKKTEEEVDDRGDEQEKGLGEEQKKSAKHEEDSEGAPKNGSENSHFFAYLVTTAIVVAALYIAYHNKRKIIAFALEGKKSKTARRPKSSDYQRLDQKI